MGVNVFGTHQSVCGSIGVGADLTFNRVDNGRDCFPMLGSLMAREGTPL